MSSSIRLGNIDFEVIPFGVDAFILRLKQSEASEYPLFQVASQILESDSEIIQDVVVGERDITVFSASKNSSALMELLGNIKVPEKIKSGIIHKVPLCFELGTDWEEIETITALSRTEIKNVLLAQTYHFSHCGFMPGFLYLTGLDPRLHCPRKAVPRKQIEPGSVGIGGKNMGVYSLRSPGGWQILGRTPHTFFSTEKLPPLSIEMGDRLKFYNIDLPEFEYLVNAKTSER